MAKISIARLADAPLKGLPGDIVANGAVEMRALIAHDEAMLHLHYLFLGQDSGLVWTRARSDYCAHVLDGSIDVNGQCIAEGGTIIIEHGASFAFSSRGSAKLALFESRETPAKQGGHVHLLLPDQTPRIDNTPDYEGTGSALMADALCPSCDLWLHGNDFPKDLKVELHSHSEDEIILVLSGEIQLGQRRFGPDTAVAVAADTLYTFKAGPDGLGFINFRAGSPTATLSESKKTIDEGMFFRDRLGRPHHQFA